MRVFQTLRTRAVQKQRTKQSLDGTSSTSKAISEFIIFVSILVNSDESVSVDFGIKRLHLYSCTMSAAEASLDS
jgi:hypothetical protein